MLSIILKVLTYLPALVTAAENLFPGRKKGAEKFDSVADIVTTVLRASEGLTGKEIVDDDKFNEGVRDVINGVVKILNASVWKRPS
jgi:hypothetical protein